MLPYIEIIRPLNGLMTAAAVWIGSIVAGGSTVPTQPVILAMLSAFLISGAGMVINDYYDINIDKINKPNRPLPSGKIKPRQALSYSALLFLAGIAISYFVNINELAVAVVVSVLVYVYSARLKKTMLVGHLIISLLVALSFVYGGLAVNNYFPTLLMAFLAFLSNMGREIFKTIEDVMGDKKYDADTLPIKFGVLKTKAFASVFVIAAVLFSFVPYFLGTFGQIYLFFVVIADISFIAAAIAPVSYSAKICKIAMIIALLAFFAAAIKI